MKQNIFFYWIAQLSKNIKTLHRALVFYFEICSSPKAIVTKAGFVFLTRIEDKNKDRNMLSRDFQ